MGFFDSQPIGRILNRMSKDIESVDQNIWIILFLATIAFAGALSSLVFLSYVDYRMLYLVVPLVVIYFFILKYYQRSNIEFKRFESNNRSPLYAHISETLVGVSTVKAFGVVDEFVQKQRRLMNVSNAPTFLRLFAQVWVSLRLELLGSTLTVTLALLGVSAADSSSLENAALIGLSLTYAIGFAGLLNLLLFSTSQLENEFNSIERLSVYCDELPQESDEVKDIDPKEQWPQTGAISFENVNLSYPSRPDVLILKDLSFSVRPGEKVGIIGRTGSGKSTLMTALYRLVELVGGKIEIDRIDIASMGLKTLRKNIEIIPQEPVLFSGTIRENLDVESLYEDVDVWDVLERIGLKEFVSSLSEKLQSPVLENGENLSVGQRQLICLGRAILSKPKILIMDEATASVDTDADALIQQSIKTHFKDSTVLSIAHRLNTIADFDRVLVLQDGVKMEFDTPHALLANPSGLFSQLADATGTANSALLREIALKKHTSLQ
jgi:ABC-type multidrug transport system fused ATPase/permease subunit